MKRLFVALTAAGLAVNLHASGFMLSGVGAKGLAMGGGGYTASVNGWESIFWNPAGLASDATPSVEVYLSLVSPKASYSPNTGILGYDGPYSMREKVNAKAQIFNIPAFGVYYGSEGSFVDGYGIAFFAPFGLGASFDLYDPPIGYYNTSDTSFQIPEFPEHDWVSDMKITAAWVGVAKNVSEKVSLGISGGPVFASLYFRRVDFVDPALSDSMAVGMPIQYRLWPMDVQLSGSGMGFGMGIGMKYQLNEKITVGLSGRYYNSVELDGQDSVVLYLPRNDYIASRDSALQFLFSGMTIPSFTNGSTVLPLPWSLGLGISYRPSDKFMVGFDVELNGHSSVRTVEVKFDSLVIMNERIYSETLSFYWKNTVKIAAGGAYKAGKFTFRTGFYYEASPIPDSTFTPLIPDTGDKLSFNAGLSVPVGTHIEFSGNVEAIFLSSRDIAPDPSYSYRSHYMPGKYTSFVGAAGASIAYKF